MMRILYLASIMAFLAALTIGYNGGRAYACGGADGDGCLMKAGHSQAMAAEKEATVTDPVCKMAAKKDPNKSIEHEGWTYYFCSKDCMKKFQGDTTKYACPCADIHMGCNCDHCTGKGVACDCLEEIKKGGGEHKHEHEHEGGGEHHH